MIIKLNNLMILKIRNNWKQKILKRKINLKDCKLKILIEFLTQI